MARETLHTDLFKSLGYPLWAGAGAGLAVHQIVINLGRRVGTRILGRQPTTVSSTSTVTEVCHKEIKGMTREKLLSLHPR